MPNPGFLMAEDAALKSRLQTLYVSDDRQQQRSVDVFFRYPDGEREKTYPFVTLELLGITHARSRQESDRIHYFTSSSSIPASRRAKMVNYFPSEYDSTEYAALQTDNTTWLYTDSFIPVDLTYQVATYCRSQRHDRQLTAAMLRHVFPLRRGFIDIPEDGTVRRCELLSWTNSDVLDQESGYSKRIFRKVFTVQINAEIPQTDIFSVKRVATVSGELDEQRTGIPAVTIFQTQEF